jgi:hypothetical protein
LGHGQAGGVTPPADLPPDAAARVCGLVHDAFGAAFLSASRPTLTVVAAVLLVGCVLSVFMTRRRPEPPPTGPPAPTAVPVPVPVDAGTAPA